jgi:hypothetical protein
MRGLCAFCGCENAEKRVEESWVHTVCPDCKGVYQTPLVILRKPSLDVLASRGNPSADHTARALHASGNATIAVRLTAEKAAAAAAKAIWKK